MGASSRHFRALMMKNYINWKRTPCGSICEILAPIMLMLILVWARLEIDPETINDYSLYSLRHPLYPTGKPSENGTYSVEITDIPAQMEDMDGFMKYVDYANINTTIKLPVNVTNVLDTLGLDEAADTFADFSDAVEDFTNITRIWNETGISNLTHYIHWDALEKLLQEWGLDDVIDVKQIQVLIEKPEETLAEALDMIDVDFEDLHAFDFEAIEVEVPIRTYIPLFDPLGPYLFYPQHCYQSKHRLEKEFAYNNPVIAYVKTNNTIEEDLINQLKALFQLQNEVATSSASIATLAFFAQFVDFDFAVDYSEIGAIAGSVGLQNATDTENQAKAGLGSDKQWGAMSDFRNPDGLAIGNFTFQAFESQAELDEYFLHENYGREQGREGICFAFSVIQEAENKFELEIQMNDEGRRWNKAIPRQTRKSYDSSAYLPNTGDYLLYQLNGFSYLQNWVANIILKRSTGKDDASIMAMMVPMRMPPWKRDDFAALLSGLLAFFVLVMYVPPVYRTVYRIVAEKENRAKEAMRMMGLKDFPYWLSWWAYFTLVNTAMVTLTWLVLIKWVFQYTDWSIIYLVVWLYGQSIFGLMMITQSVFTRARAAAITTSLIYWGSSMIMEFASKEEATEFHKTLASLSPPVAMIQTIGVMARYEQSGVGIRWINIHAIHNLYSVQIGLVMMCINCVYLVLLGIYLEQVMPKTVGTRRHPCFFVFPSFWKEMFNCKTKREIQPSRTKKIAPRADETSARPSTITVNGVETEQDLSQRPMFGDVELTTEFETKYLNPQCYEKVQVQDILKEETGDLLTVTDLMKTYPNGTHAVRGLNVKMYSDQIFVLLGHNGAGKTSTIGMLTGLFRASYGTANIFGQDILNDKDEVRKLMGVCPQHDVLFDLLTPEEHLSMFYEFKGADKSNKRAEINKLLEDIGVADKRENLAKTLSGGNKRKLSVAIALCGGSKFVLLDEPTSGLDISARRQLWNMLKEHKKDRVILLTTHYMDEADILGDRIGVMHQGKMTCLGSSMFLKNRFGVGYVMTIEKASPEINMKIIPYMLGRLGPDIHKVSEIAGEMTVQIPNKYSFKFKDFFEGFDNDLELLGIQSYGISITTLEQVFLKIGNMDDPSQLFKKQEDVAVMDDASEMTATATGTPFKGKTISRPVLLDGNSSVITKLDRPETSKGHQTQDRNSEKNSSKELTVYPNDETQSQKARSTAAMPDSKQSQDEESKDSQQPQDLEINANSSQPGESDSNKGDSTKQPNPLETMLFSEKPQSDQNQRKVILDDDGRPFSLMHSKLDNSFCSNLVAILIKRTNNYKRNKKVVFNEVILPALAMITGVLIANVRYNYRSPPETLSPEMYPANQNIFYNAEPVDTLNSNVPTSQLIQKFPMYESMFKTQETNGARNATEMYDFSDLVYEYGQQYCGVEPYQYGSFEIYQANNETQEYKFVNYVNLTSQDVAMVYPQYMYEAILKVANNDPNFEFKVTSRPYPYLAERLIGVRTFDGGTIVFFAAIAYSLICTVTISYLVQERIQMLKHVQVISGMRLSSYWIANFIFDFLKMYVTVITTVVIFQIFKSETLDYDSSVIVYCLFPFGILPCLYVCSFIFSADSAAQTMTMFWNFILILIFPTTVFLLRFANKLEHIGDILHYAIKIAPSQSLGSVIFFENAGGLLAQWREMSEGTGQNIRADEWAWENNTLDIMLMGGHFVFWFFILFLIEIDLGKRCRRFCTRYCERKVPMKDDVQIDNDVLEEEKRVADTEPDKFRIKVENLRKVYWIDRCRCRRKKEKSEQEGPGGCTGTPLVAVENLSFGLKSGECFALLGVNGAGKSTTFKNLTCEVEPTEGNIHIGSLDINKDFNKIRKLIGYCPQTNPIFDSLSVEEHIYYFARIKGVPTKLRSSLVDQAIEQLGLQQYRKKLAGQLSGGNKRKLSVAIAIVGSPPIILLDEPSAGMDPTARRFMWEVVADISSNKTSAVILTTHSMEEAEALSTKMGIMVKGGIFKCFGSSQHIKDKFGTGYIIEVKSNQLTRDQIQNIVSEELKLDKVTSKKQFNGEEVRVMLEAINCPEVVIETILQQEQESKLFRASEIANELSIKRTLFGFVQELCETFRQVEVIEQYGNYMRLRVQKQDKKIGFLFKLAEELKVKYDLSEYAAHQTTLEQIFQGFANLTFYEKILTYTIDAETQKLTQQK